ncbi:hypothetical protein [Streptomyces monashensis]|uniref:hypothetical protein n=1 Tax=Streptomyces monashensis TaxID=1678012 RepID=UPI000A8C40A8|nr:hypothetical protein [Streptomyces monashensis]
MLGAEGHLLMACWAPFIGHDVRVQQLIPGPAPVILAVDDLDLRALPRAARLARTTRDGVQLLHEHRDVFIDEFWLDHDLGGDDSISRW